MKSLIIMLFSGLVLFNFLPNDNPQIPGYELINSKDLMEHVEFLSSESCAGRLAGSEGFNRATKYASDLFSKFGLIPMGDSSYYQYFNLEYNDITGPCDFNLVENNKIKKEYKIGDDYICRGFTGSGNVRAQVIFCGYGISSPELGYDDYAGADVKNKIVMAFKYNPSWKPDNGSWPDGSPRAKARVAKSKGAKAIIFVSTPNDKNPQKPIASVMSGDGPHLDDFPMIHAEINAADDFLKTSKTSLKDLQTEIDSAKSPVAAVACGTAELNVKAKYFPEQRTQNVVGLLPGNDPKLKNEYIVLGAHIDHVGMQDGKVYFPGANDNASGSAAVMEIAKAFTFGKVQNKRSIIFVLFSAEESGLKGAQFFADHSPVDTSAIAAMINFDCVGHGDSIRIGGGKSAPELYSIAKNNDSEYIHMLISDTWKGGGADAEPFYQKGIPALYFVTTNSYTHLHYWTDKPSTLNKSLFENLTKLGYLTAYDLAMGNYNREELQK